MSKNRIFRKHTVTVTILTADDDIQIEDRWLSELSESEHVLVDLTYGGNTVLTGKEMADASTAVRGEPEFFDLDKDGNDFDEDDLS